VRSCAAFADSICPAATSHGHRKTFRRHPDICRRKTGPVSNVQLVAQHTNRSTRFTTRKLIEIEKKRGCQTTQVWGRSRHGEGYWTQGLKISHPGNISNRAPHLWMLGVRGQCLTKTRHIKNLRRSRTAVAAVPRGRRSSKCIQLAVSYVIF
jgi:hypothetical protein